MSVRPRKLPAHNQFLQDIRRGLGTLDLAELYGVSPGHMRKLLKGLGLRLPSRGRLLDEKTNIDKVIIKRRVATGDGEVSFTRISLPRISMHVAYLETAHG